MVSNRISVEDFPICFMVRNEPVNPSDSGWAFYSGVREDDDYASNASNFQIFSLNTIANVDPNIIPLLDAPIGTMYERASGDDAWSLAED
jgi:hypothetical protein